jgi:putative CRISPR-associated protein (TIGR02619 family)
MKNLICTVGTSLKNNLAKDDKLYKFYKESKFKKIADALFAMEPSEYICGAEINSNYFMSKRDYININGADLKIYLLHSDSEDGLNVTNIIKDYYYNYGIKCELKVIEGLRANNPREFNSTGLKNLVIIMAHIIKDYGKENVLINATGGYKPQIALATVIGQVLGVNIFYKNEQFNEVVCLNPLPVNLDLELWLNAKDVFNKWDLDPYNVVSQEDLSSEIIEDKKYSCFFESTIMDKKRKYSLNAMGLLFHMEASKKFGNEKNIQHLRVDPAQKKVYKTEDGHIKGNKRLNNFANKLLNNEFIVGLNSKYYNLDLPQKTGFCFDNNNNIICIYSDGTTTAQLVAETKAKTRQEKQELVKIFNTWIEKEL